MTLTMELADYLAKACGLPSLFIGKYGDLEINYFWSITNEDAWGHPRITTTLINSNKWLLGLNYYWRENISSQTVDLTNHDDSLLKILKHHNSFPSPLINDGYRLRGSFFHKYGYKNLFASNPSRSTKVSVELDEAFNKMLETIHEKSQQNQDVISPPIQLSQPKGDFLNFLQFAYQFGLSGIVGQASSPDNIEYILFLHIYSLPSPDFPNYIFVRSASWLRGMKFQYSCEQGEDIIDLPEIELDWQHLFNEPHDEGQRGIDSIIYIILYRKGETINTALKLPSETDTSSSLWNALRPLIEQLNKDAS